MRSFSLILLFSVAFLGPMYAFAVPEKPPPTTGTAAPSPALDPADVVRAQLEALKADSDAGIAVVFRFASPTNRSQTGPLERFTQMLRAGYPELLGHRAAKLSPTVIEGDQAFQGVELTARDGSSHRYVFLLSRQSAVPFQDCWMTDSVLNPDQQAPRKAAPEI